MCFSKQNFHFSDSIDTPSISHSLHLESQKPHYPMSCKNSTQHHNENLREPVPKKRVLVKFETYGYRLSISPPVFNPFEEHYQRDRIYITHQYIVTNREEFPARFKLWDYSWENGHWLLLVGFGGRIQLSTTHCAQTIPIFFGWQKLK
jgi:hypothetical protein